MLCQFLLYRKVSQLYVQICIYIIFHILFMVYHGILNRVPCAI